MDKNQKVHNDFFSRGAIHEAGHMVPVTVFGKDSDQVNLCSVLLPCCDRFVLGYRVIVRCSLIDPVSKCIPCDFHPMQILL